MSRPDNLLRHTNLIRKSFQLFRFLWITRTPYLQNTNLRIFLFQKRHRTQKYINLFHPIMKCHTGYNSILRFQAPT